MTRGGRKKVRTAPERRCAVTGARGGKEELIRFVVAPDGQVVPDLAGKLPGRGVWVGANRALVREAVRRNVFARSARRNDARAGAEFAAEVEMALVRRLREALGLARRAGCVVSGFEQTRARLRRGRVGVLIEARDGAEDGRRKLRALAPTATVLDCLDAAELGTALGRARLVHGAIEPGGAAVAVRLAATRLAGYREEPAEITPSARKANSERR